MNTYYTPKGGLPDQNTRSRDRAILTTAYAVLPRDTLSSITASALPGWDGATAWILARPLTGFAETFAQLIVTLAPGGGAAAPEPDAGAEAALFVLDGTLALDIDGTAHVLAPGAFAYVPPGAAWSVHTHDGASFVWVRKRHVPAPGLDLPDALVTSDADVAPTPMPGTEGKWATTRFIDPADLRHDMHLNIVTFQPGATIPFAETHVMEHGIYILQGRGNYLLNDTWVEVEAGDFLWLRAFCPQACYAAGPGPFRYLLYKDVNRLPSLRLADL